MPLFTRDFKMRIYIVLLLLLGFVSFEGEGRARKTSTGIILSGEVPEVRAMEPFGGSVKRENAYAATLNKFKGKVGNSVKVWCMLIPNSTAFYCPPEMKSITRNQQAAINNVYSKLSGIRTVDVFSALDRHKAEKIYSRTDHHWSPLGAYYAAQAFASVAGLPFMPLSSYKKETVHGYVGSMAAFSKDPSVRKSPEDFIYYVPQGIDYTVTFIPYSGSGKHKKEGKPVAGRLFYKYKDGSGAAYCTFMQGDSKIAQIKTDTKNGRKLVILKDSYGNALPSNLLASFQEIHVIDFRYFDRNLIRYIRDHGITDVLFANNIVHANNPAVVVAYNGMF